jgi:hypothetical protein
MDVFPDPFLPIIADTFVMLSFSKKLDMKSGFFLISIVPVLLFLSPIKFVLKIYLGSADKYIKV